MGACCSSSTPPKNSTSEKIKEGRKSRKGDDVHLDTNLDNSVTNDNQLEKTNTLTFFIEGDLKKLEQQLNKSNIDINDYANSNKTLFHEAILKTKSTEIIDYLITKKNANIDLPEKETGNTPIFLAAVDLKRDIVKLLLKYKANLKIKNNEGQDCLTFLKEWNNDGESPKRRSSLRRELTPEERDDYLSILTMLESAMGIKYADSEEDNLNDGNKL